MVEFLSIIEEFNFLVNSDTVYFQYILSLLYKLFYGKIFTMVDFGILIK